MDSLYSRRDLDQGYKLSPFDPKKSCSMCGCRDVGTCYVPTSCNDQKCSSTSCTVEHLERRCERCRYAWAETAGVEPEPREGEPREGDLCVGPFEGARFYDGEQWLPIKPATELHEMMRWHDGARRWTFRNGCPVRWTHQAANWSGYGPVVLDTWVVASEATRLEDGFVIPDGAGTVRVILPPANFTYALASELTVRNVDG